MRTKDAGKASRPFGCGSKTGNYPKWKPGGNMDQHLCNCPCLIFSSHLFGFKKASDTSTSLRVDPKAAALARRPKSRPAQTPTDRNETVETWAPGLKALTPATQRLCSADNSGVSELISEFTSPHGPQKISAAGGFSKKRATGKKLKRKPL